MSGHTHHPDTEELADFQAGLVSGTRGKRLAAHVSQCSLCTSTSDRIDAVSTELATAPALKIPHQVERRITAALLTEAAARDSRARQAERVVPDERPPPRRPRLWTRRVPVLTRAFTVPLGALVPAAVFVVLAVAGYILSLPSPALSHPASSAAGLAGPGGHHDVISTGSRRVPVFVVTASGTDYLGATLRAQIRQKVQADSSSSGIASAPVRTGSGAQSVAPRASTSARASAAASPTASAAANDPAPPGSLVGCVMRLTGDHEPALVDRADYDSRPAYVIAVPDHAWVVGRDCTAAHPAVIESVALSPAA
jgi:hypothetical protein